MTEITDREIEFLNRRRQWFDEMERAAEQAKVRDRKDGNSDDAAFHSKLHDGGMVAENLLYRRLMFRDPENIAGLAKQMDLALELIEIHEDADAKPYVVVLRRVAAFLHGQVREEEFARAQRRSS